MGAVGSVNAVRQAPAPCRAHAPHRAPRAPASSRRGSGKPHSVAVVVAHSGPMHRSQSSCGCRAPVSRTKCGSDSHEAQRVSGFQRLAAWDCKALRPLGTSRILPGAGETRATRNGRSQRPVRQLRRRKHRSSADACFHRSSALVGNWAAAQQSNYTAAPAKVEQSPAQIDAHLATAAPARSQFDARRVIPLIHRRFRVSNSIQIQNSRRPKVTTSRALLREEEREEEKAIIRAT